VELGEDGLSEGEVMGAWLAAAVKEFVGWVGLGEFELVGVGEIEVVEGEGRNPELVRGGERGGQEAG
jgi:hypothetical protein